MTSTHSIEPITGMDGKTLPINEFADAEYQENSLEMQMPFIKYRFPRARIAPVLMGDHSPVF